LIGTLGGGAKGLFQPFPRQPLPGLNVGGVTLIDPASGVETEESLNVAHDLATGRLGLEHLPEEAFESQAQAKDPLAAIGAFVGR
jgi:hypothetical protein